MKQLISKSELRDEVLDNIKRDDNIFEREYWVILLSINLENTLNILNKVNPNINTFIGIEYSEYSSEYLDLIEYNFEESALLSNLTSKCNFNKETCILEKNENISLELNSYNENNENILFLLLKSNKTNLFRKVLNGIGKWNDYSIFTRNMNNEIFIFNLYNKEERELKEISRSLIFDHFNSDNINIQNEEGNSLLHLAISNKDKETVNFCLLNGANPYLKNHFNLTPFENQDLTDWEDVIDAFSVEVNV
ncbi:ankyrin repeat domain-containing protein [Leptospira levettii]|uniref:ankyrin repeat domain-containing protein n=1 Tax=Leptospira levettii TaxID=2023178 RepID=UPI000C297C49|nr:ankyrin repeat domain-containing protein [Leptospira levettii]PJZ89047.1 hypothetical protein CH368_08455 [Leptospira levettii]